MSRLNMVGLSMETNTQTISTENVLQLIADPRRRTILHHLRETGGIAVSVDELTDALATKRTEPSPRDATNTLSSRQSADDAGAKAELHHDHLPRLADAGIIEYDRHDGLVRYHAHERLESLLQFVSTHLE